MSRIRLIHWNAAEAAERAQGLRAAGYAVSAEPPTGPRLMQELREGVPPDAIVIDLSRLPSQGRDVALSIRSVKATRATPIVFVEGDPAKTARTRELLPEAVFTTWADIIRDLADAIAHPPAAAAKALSVFAGYSGRPLPAKLGIKAGFVVALVGAPEGFVETLVELPPGVIFQDQASSKANLVLWFVRSQKELETQAGAMASQIEKNSLWIVWPKKASGMATDVGEREVRAAGLALGLVDFKIAAIDATWSGLLFRRRK